MYIGLREAHLEKNPLFTKEKADFIFNRIQRYYDQRAYRQALEEVDKHRELLGSVLNVGSQMSLNKMILKSVVHSMLDAFEVDGDLARFSSLFSQHKTLIELHTDHKTHEILHKYLLEKESNPNFRSKSEYNNNIVPYENEIFPDEGVVQMSIKSSAQKTPSAKDIEQDFLDSIEKPSFQYGHLTEEEMEQPGEILRSDVNVKAIHEDFFRSIRSPKLDHRSVDPSEDIEQLSFDSPTKHTSSKKRSAKKTNDLEKTQVFEQLSLTKETLPEKNTADGSKDVPIEPIAIKGTVLDKGDPTQALREKIRHLEAKLGNEDRPRECSSDPLAPEQVTSCVKERREILSNGEKRTETIHRSGGKITEIVIDGYSLAEEKKNNGKNKKKKSVDRSGSKNEPRKKVKEPPKNSSKKRSDRSASPKKDKAHPKAQKKEVNPFVLLVSLCMIALLLFGGYKLLNRDRTTPPDPPASTSDSQGQGTTDQSTADQGTSSDKDTTEPSQNTPSGTIDEADSYILPSHERELTKADLQGMTKSEIRYAINEMFARHGWNFGGAGEFFDHFSTKNWYQPDLSMTSSSGAESKFSKIERANLRLLLESFKSM